jgi:hypothetical protein
MPTDDLQTDRIDWSLTMWEGARREQMRRWRRMPLADMIRVLEEMQVLAEKLVSRLTQVPWKELLDPIDRMLCDKVSTCCR